MSSAPSLSAAIYMFVLVPFMKSNVTTNENLAYRSISLVIGVL